MWQIANATPFAAAQGWVRGLEGEETWLVVVKATFDVLPDGRTRIAADQPAPVRSPEYWGEPGKSSLRYDNDFVLAKETTDVTLNGTAYAPAGGAVGQLDVGLSVAGVHKRLRIFGDRYWAPGCAWISSPQPFVSMPLRYERAFGGIDRKSSDPERHWYWPNPIGIGFATSRANAADSPLPNIESPDGSIATWDDRPSAAGFGAMASHWETRARLAGTYDAEWERRRQPLLPRDFDVRHYQCSPPDQRPAQFLKGGETVVLDRLVPAGSLRFALPLMQLALRTRFQSGERVDHPSPRLHTVILEPDFPRVSLVWHSALPCHAQVYQLERTRIDLREDQLSLADEDVQALLGV